jgi:hypothetical protein
LSNTLNYFDSGYDADYNFGSIPRENNVVVAKFNGTTSTGYVNGVESPTSTILSTVNGGQFIANGATQTLGKSPYNEFLNGEMYTFMSFNTALTDSDRLIASNLNENDLTGYFYSSLGTQPTKGLLNTISSTGQNGCTGAFSLVRVNSAYIGPTIRFRNNANTVNTDFYADYTGILNTSIDQLGTSYSSWYTTNGGGSSVFVTVWYDQSNNNNHSYQPTTTLQPVYNSTNSLLDFSIQSNSHLLSTSIGIPTGTLNAPYSFVVRHGTISGTGGILGAGINSTNQSNSLRGFSDGSNTGYLNYWTNNNLSIGSNAQRVTGNTVSVTYNGSLQTAYINGTNTNSRTATGATTASGTQYIGVDVGGSFLNGQMYYVLIFKSALSDADRIICESTSILPSVNPLILPAESALIIKDLTNINLDGVYYINVNGASTPLYCLMNDIYEGGGWVMLMKGIRGNTFQYDSNYWSTQNTLNAADVSRIAGDSKYANFNNNHISDVLAIFPDILSNSATNVYGRNGGSLNLDDGWLWKVNNWNLYAPIVNQLSSASQTGLRGAYSCSRVNVNYTGPTIRLRTNTTVIQDFYANVAGNLGTMYDATGISYQNWLSANGSGTVFVVVWYDQSGNGRHATQDPLGASGPGGAGTTTGTTAAQPIFVNVDRGYIDSQNSSTQFLYMGPATNGPIPSGGGAYSHNVRHRSINNTTTGAFFGSGSTTTNNSNVLRMNGTGAGTSYMNDWWANDYIFGTYSGNNAVSVTFNGSNSRIGYINPGGNSTPSASAENTGTGLNNTNVQQFLFRDLVGNWLNGQIFHAFFFNNTITTADINVLSTTNYLPQSTLASNYTQSKCTALTGFQVSRDAGNAGNPYVFSGYSSTLFGTQTGAFGHVFGGGLHRYYNSTNSYIRWGILTNNEGDFATVDHIHGIGLNDNNVTVYSAGGVGTGVNRSMRFEMYGR